jgi:PAS domain S-box-containing protein
MRKRASGPTVASVLRKRAEGRLARRGASHGDAPEPSQLLQELEIHRVELEMQNEQLRTTQTELAEGLDRYTQLFDFAPIGYATLDPTGAVLQMNHVGATLLGKSRAHLVGRAFMSYVAKPHRAAFISLLKNVLTDNLKKACEVELVRELADRPTVRLTATTLAGKEPTVLLAFEDISAQKRAELALRRADDELREADRRKDQFLAVLSHELRTPLSSLLLYGQLLQRTRLDEAGIRRTGEMIERAAKAQSRLIEDLLDVSRIAAGKLSMRRDEVSLGATVRAAVEAVAGEARKRSIDLAVAIDPGVPPVIGDPTRLQQAVWNLLSNAIKFTPENGRIDVTLDQVDDHARIEVRDTGAGIDPEFLPYLFVRFSQADRTTTRSAGGLGLGLSIAHSVVEAHRGHIRAESAGRGQGSTFTIVLPTTATRFEGWTSKAPVQPVVEANIRGARLLVVEDDAATRVTLTEVLELAGASVQGVASADAAMKLLDRFKPDLLLCDIAMPVEDGCSLLRRIRARGTEHGGDVRALALTAFAAEEDRARTRAAGFAEHLAKPVDFEKLLVTVSSLLPKAGDHGPTALSRS